MKIELYPKNMLEALWKEDKKWFSNRVGQIPKCLRCGNPLDSQLLINPLSRHADILVCHQCGTDEAFRDAGKVILPFQCWYGIEDVRLKDLPESKNPALTSDCAFLMFSTIRKRRRVRLPVPAQIMTDTDGGLHGTTARKKRHPGI